MIRLHNGRIALYMHSFISKTGKEYVEFEYLNGTISSMPLSRWNSLVEWWG